MKSSLHGSRNEGRRVSRKKTERRNSYNSQPGDTMVGVRQMSTVQNFCTRSGQKVHLVSSFVRHAKHIPSEIVIHNEFAF